MQWSNKAMLNWLIENISDSGGIMKELRKIRLGELVDFQTGPFGTQFSASEYVNEGIPVINVKNIGVGMVIRENLDYISEQTRDRLSQHILKTGDIVFGRKGSVDRHAYIFQNENGWVQGSDCIRARKKTPVNMLFLSQYLEGNGVKKQIINAAVGSTMPSLNTDILKDITVLLPNIEEQNRISVALKKIDDKICLNSKINDNLEQQLMLLYDYWFIQFDFPDNDGNPYQTSGGKMVWNDTLKRNIPENWKVQSVISNCLSSIIKPGVEIFNTKTYLATADVKGTSISTGTIVDYDGRESRANMQPSINSVWFAKMKNSIKHLYLNKEMQPIISSSILSTGFCGLQCNEISFEYIASYVSNAYFEIHKDMLAHGATQEAVNNDDLAGVHIIIPEAIVLRAYHEATQAIYAQISKNICENQELVKLRDWLLPMLMNGQATISD